MTSLLRTHSPEEIQKIRDSIVSPIYNVQSWKEAVLDVHITSANLTGGYDFIGKLDPYCELVVESKDAASKFDLSKSMSEKEYLPQTFRTKLINNTHVPKWDQYFTLDVDEFSVVYVSVWDAETFTADVLLGYAVIEPSWFDWSDQAKKYQIVERDIPIIPEKDKCNGTLKITITKKPVAPALKPSFDFNSLVEEMKSIPDEKKYDIVFQGGGVKGLAYGPAMRVITDTGIKVRRVVGTSAGAITALSVALHYSADELDGVMAERTENGDMIFSTFLDVHEHAHTDDFIASFAKHFHALGHKDQDEETSKAQVEQLQMNLHKLLILLHRGSLCKGDTAVAFLKKCMDLNGRNLGKATLKQLYDVTQIDLNICCTDQTDHQILVLNHRTAPSCPVAYAARMSMSIPFLWEDVIWREKWGTYCGQNIAGHSIVDGGILSNCPLEYVMESSTYVRKVMGDTPPIPDRVICFVFDKKTPIGWLDPNASHTVPCKAPSVFSHIKSSPLVVKMESLLSTCLDAHDFTNFTTYADKIVFIPALEVDTTEFHMPEDKLHLFRTKAAEKTTELLKKMKLIPQ
jgi:predicted acylesterase/phospholipase RssA